MRFRLMQFLCITITVLALSHSAQAVEAPLGISGAETINVFEAKQLYDRGAVFIDVRSDEEWNIGHIEGAVHLDFQRDFGKLYHAKAVHKDTPLVIYCNSADCLRSAYACAVSVFWGFTEVYYFRSGYFAWMLADFPAVMAMTAELEPELVSSR